MQGQTGKPSASMWQMFHHSHNRTLFQPTLDPHQPRNVNLMHEAEKAAGNFNQQVAVRLTSIFQAMPTFWLIMAWIVLWIAANATIVHFDSLPWPLLLCLASVPQLPLMIVIMVGQGLLGRKQELQAEEQFLTTQKTYHDIEQVMQHLSAQDAELVKQTHMLIHLLSTAGVTPEQLAAFQSSIEASTLASSEPAVSTGNGTASTPDGSQSNGTTTTKTSETTS